MDLKVCTFNCKGFYIAKVKHLKSILKECDILLLQETWALTLTCPGVGKKVPPLRIISIEFFPLIIQ